MTRLTIDLNQLAHNYNTLKGKLSPTTKIIAVVKANAYGLGAVTIAQKLVSLGADILAVAYAQEGVQLRKAGINSPILVFYPQPENCEEIIAYDLEPALYSSSFIDVFSRALQAKKKKNYPVHLKCNTGLNRIGLSENDLNLFLEKKIRFPFDVKSVYSHLASSENLKECSFTKQQLKQFSRLKEIIEQHYKKPPLFHLLNTSGVFNYPEYQLDAIRTGIGLYGFANRSEWDKELEPIATLSSTIVQIHSLKKGESVGYNQGWIAEKESQIAVLSLGHADGINRQYGHGKGGCWINNEYAPTVGNICMDMLMIDITGISCEIGDEAVLFDSVHTADELAKKTGTISYELLTALSARIKRTIV